MVRVGWLALVLVAACGDSAAVEFPGDDVAPRWSVVATGDSEGAAVAVLPGGDVVVAAVVSSDFSGAGFSIGQERFTVARRGLILVKLSGDDGSVVASTQFEDLVIAVHLAADASGDIFVAAMYAEPVNLGGDDLPAPRDLNHVVARLSGGDLAHVWSRPLDATANFAGFRLETDEAGDVIAVLENEERLYVEKLSGADGATVWTAEPIAEDSEATGATVLADGDLVVGGYLQDPATVFHPVALRLAADDGAVMWEKRFTGSGRGGIAEDVEAIDGGDLLLVGSTGGEVDLDGTTTGSNQMFAARLSTDGELRWAAPDICESGCFGPGPFPVRLRGATVAYVVSHALAFDSHIAVQTLSIADGSIDSTLRFDSSTFDILGDLAAGADGRPVLTGRTGWDVDLDTGDEISYGSLFVVAL